MKTYSKALLIIVLIAISISSFSQVTPPCDLNYGTSSNEENIIYQMRYGEISEAENAIYEAMNTRGIMLGCSQVALSYDAPNISQPALSEVENIWNNNIAPQIDAITISCPKIGRYENNIALGAYYASLAGYYDNFNKLAEIGNMMCDQQYILPNSGNVFNARFKGVYAYANYPETDDCYLGGVAGSSTSQICNTIPSLCKEYTSGQFAGVTFAIGSQDDFFEWHDGGMSYDHGWVGIQMIEAAIQQTDTELKDKFRESACLAGLFAINEFCVKNHNYTAKLIWLLAELYAWSGEEQFKNELNYKLNKNLIPGILYDSDNDGFVDNTDPAIAFADLTTNAQTPGRMWDAHNSIIWYQAMNTWALTEAYVAFRDRGDTERANELKPYVIAMMDNICDEILNQGVITPDQLGTRDITYALLIAIWKIAQYEDEEHQNWENAAWAMWNTDYFDIYSTHSVCVGLYLLALSETPYETLVERETFVSTNNKKNNTRLTISPNPFQENISVNFSNKNNKFTYEVFNIAGKQIIKSFSKSNSINLANIDNGIYLIKIIDSKNNIYYRKILKI